MPGGSCKSIETYVNLKDMFSQRVGDWAEKVSDGHFRLKICPQAKVLNFNKGKKSFFQNPESKKYHKPSISSNNNSSKPTLQGTLEAQQKDDTVTKAKDFGIVLMICFARHSFHLS